MHDAQSVALSKLRLDNAKERLSYIPGILAIGDYKTVANRAYYAVFFAMRAVLALDGFDSKKHAGIIAEFRRRYIKTGIFPTEMSDIIAGLFQIRTSSDYDDFYIVSKETVETQAAAAQTFVRAVEDYLQTQWAE